MIYEATLETKLKDFAMPFFMIRLRDSICELAADWREVKISRVESNPKVISRAS